MTAGIWTELDRASARDLRTLQMKLTYVGPQLKPVPSVAFTSFFHVLRTEWFDSTRSPGISYANDEYGMWNFTARPEELVDIASQLSWLSAEGDAPAGERIVSLAMVMKESRVGELSAEFLLDRSRTKDAVDSLVRVLSRGNGIARDVLTLFSESLPT